MSPYDRNYANSSAYANDYVSYGKDESALKSFVKQTYQLFAASLLAGTAGAYVGYGMAQVVSSFYWGLVILEFALIFGLNFTKDKPGLALGVLFAFTFVSGLTLAPLLSVTLGIAGGGGIVANAFLMTTATFGALTMFAIKTTKDFTSFGKPLLIALIVVVVIGIVNIFLGSPILQVAIAGVSAILFSFFILFDTQNIIRGNYDSPVLAASALYLDFLNLFISLLQILGIFGGSSEE